LSAVVPQYDPIDGSNEGQVGVEQSDPADAQPPGPQ
jgi:hypothetical protein